MSARFTLREMALTLATGIGPITEPNDFDAALDDYRAEVLREAANALVAGPVDSLVSAAAAWVEAIELLRSMADEAATGGA